MEQDQRRGAQSEGGLLREKRYQDLVGILEAPWQREVNRPPSHNNSKQCLSPALPISGSICPGGFGIGSELHGLPVPH